MPKVREIIFTIKNKIDFLKMSIDKPATEGLVQHIQLLLGLLLRYCLRGKYSDVFTPIFQINFVDLFWSVLAAVANGKHGNVKLSKNLIKVPENFIFDLRI